MRREEDISFVRLQVVVECLDRFQVQMVGRSVQAFNNNLKTYKEMCIRDRFTRAYSSRPQLPDEASGYTTVFPIPEKIRVMNERLKQNPGY